MSETIQSALITLAPIIGAVATIVVAIVKLGKSFKDSSGKIINTLKTKVESQNTEIKNLINVNVDLARQVESLNKQNEEISYKLDSTSALNTKVDQLMNDLEAISSDLQVKVDSTLRQGLSGVETLKNDLKAIGENYEEPKND